MNDALHFHVVALHPGLDQCGGVATALIAQGVQPGGGDDGWRRGGVVAMDRIGPRFASDWRIAIHEPVHRLLGQDIALGKFLHRSVMRFIRGRIDRGLHDDRYGRRLRRKGLGHDNGQVPASTVSRGDQPGGAASQFGRAASHPAGRCLAIVRGGGVGRLHESSSAEEHDNRAGVTLCAGIVAAQRNGTAGAGAGQILDHRQRQRIGFQHGPHGEIAGAGIGQWYLAHFRSRHCGQRIKHSFYVGTDIGLGIGHRGILSRYCLIGRLSREMPLD